MKTFVAMVGFAGLLISGPIFAQCQAGMPTVDGTCIPRNAPGVPGNSPGPAIPAQVGPTWVTTWGAIAFDSATSKAGTAVGLLSERKAKRAAINDCENKGASNCKILFAYENQCSAVAWGGQNSSGRLFAWHAATVEKASELATSDCKSQTQADCGIVYSDCSRPILK